MASDMYDATEAVTWVSIQATSLDSHFLNMCEEDRGVEPVPLLRVLH